MRPISSNGSNFLFQTVECTSMELQPRPLSWLRPWQSMARRQSSGMWKSCTFIQRGQGLTISQNIKVYYGDKHFKWSVLVKKKKCWKKIYEQVDLWRLVNVVSTFTMNFPWIKVQNINYCIEFWPPPPQKKFILLG